MSTTKPTPVHVLMKPRTHKLNAHRTLEYYTPEDVQKLVDQLGDRVVTVPVISMATPAPARGSHQVTIHGRGDTVEGVSFAELPELSEEELKLVDAAALQIFANTAARVIAAHSAKHVAAQAPRVDPPSTVVELMHVALAAVHSFARPENWNDPEDPEQAEAWTLVDAALLAYKKALESASQPQAEAVLPTITAEEAREFQRWKGMDGATAFHLIERHADGWADVGVMMNAWLEANAAPQGLGYEQGLAQRDLAEVDADLLGVGFLVDGACVHPSRVEVIHASQPQADPVGEIVDERREVGGWYPVIRWDGGVYPSVGTKLYAAPQPQAEPVAIFPNRLPDVDASDAPAHWYHKGWNDCRTQALRARAPQPQPRPQAELVAPCPHIERCDCLSGCKYGLPGRFSAPQPQPRPQAEPVGEAVWQYRMATHPRGWIDTSAEDAARWGNGGFEVRCVYAAPQPQELGYEQGLAQRDLAEVDAALFGVGFLVDGACVHPSRVEVIHAPAQAEGGAS